MVDVYAVAPTHVAGIWPLVEKYVADSLEFAQGCFLPEDIKVFCERGAMQLWIATKGDNVLCACVSEIVNYPRKRVISVPFIGGKDMRSWFRKMLYTIEAWSKEMGCVGLQGGARRGWGKLAKMKECGVTLYKDYDFGSPMKVMPPNHKDLH